MELWYFTSEGCSDASQHQLTQYDDAFGLTKVDDVVALKSVSSLKASKNVVPDAELSQYFTLPHTFQVDLSGMIPSGIRAEW